MAVKELGRNAFSKEKLTSIDLPEGLETIGVNSLSANQLEKIELPSTTKSIEMMGLAQNQNLKEVQLNEGLKRIGDRAFNGSSSLESISLPSSLHSLGNLVFNQSGLAGKLIFGPNLQKVGDNPFQDTPNNISVQIAEGSTPLQIGINAFEAHQDQVNIPQGRPITFHARSFQAAGEISLDGGVVEVSDIKDTATIQSQLHNRLPLSIVTHQGRGQISWDLAGADYDSKTDLYRIKGQFNTQSLAENDALSASRLIPTVQLKQVEKEQTNPSPEENQPVESVWTAEDFEYGLLDYKPALEEQYQVFGITSFSALGLEKAQTEKDLVIPQRVHFEDVDYAIKGIGTSAFKDVNLNSLVIPERDHEFIIKGSAFENTGLTSVSFGEGLEFIGPRAFYNNNLSEVHLPSTVWATGSQSFMNNSIESLTIHPEVERLQIDNYSFAHNELKEVDLPYDIFKFREYVFKANPGVEELDSNALMPNDPLETGVVKLNTLNPHHLRVDTYIAPSQYHQIINLAPDINRDDLFNQLRTAQDLIDTRSHFDQSESYDLARLLSAAKRLFFNPSASQEQINRQAQALSTLIADLDVGNLSDLRQILDQAERINTAIYTADSLKQLNTAIQNAKQELATDYSEQSLDRAISQLEQSLKQLEIIERLQYKQADFTYDGSTVTGLSESGLEKKVENKHLVIPRTNPNGQAITAIADRAFESDAQYGSDTSRSQYGFQSVVLPKTLTHIGNRAFFSNNLTAVDFPDSLESIGYAAFNGNNIQSIILPEGFHTLGAGAFALNESKEVSLPSSLTEISNGAFSRNISLTQVNLSEGQRVIGQSAFVGAPLQSIDIPSSVESIERMAFQSSRLEELTIPSNVKTIGREAFNQNAKWPTLKSLTLEEGVESIGRLAFANALLSQVFLPESLDELDPRAFEGNRNEYGDPVIVKLYSSNPDHLAFNTEESANNHIVIYFDGDREYNLNDFSYDGTTITGFSEQGQVKFNFNKNVVLPEFNLEGESIQAIGAGAFHVTEGVHWNRSNSISPHGMQSVVIPDTVKLIGANAFRTNSLTAIDLPDQLVEIGDLAFNGNQLEEVTIPGTVTRLGKAAFSANPTKEVTISEGIKDIPAGLFGRNGKLKRLNLAEGLESIGDSAFMGATLTDMTLPSTVESIGRMAFNTNHLEKLEIPASVKIIGPQAFQQKEAPEWPDLKELILHEGLEEIGRNAFEGTGITEVYLPHSLKKLAYDAFDTVLDDEGNQVVVKLYSSNPEHLAFNTEKSLDHQEVILIETESREEEREQVLVYEIETRYSDELKRGESRVVRPGRNGLLKLTERVDYRQGQEIGRQIISTEVVQAPQPAIIEIGRSQAVEPDEEKQTVVRQETRQINIPFQTIKRANDQLNQGQVRLIQSGQEGIYTIVEEVTYTGGLVSQRQLVDHQLTQVARNEIIEYGTKIIEEEINPGQTDSPNYQPAEQSKTPSDLIDWTKLSKLDSIFKDSQAEQADEPTVEKPKTPSELIDWTKLSELNPYLLFDQHDKTMVRDQKTKVESARKKFEENKNIKIEPLVDQHSSNDQLSQTEVSTQAVLPGTVSLIASLGLALRKKA